MKFSALAKTLGSLLPIALILLGLATRASTEPVDVGHVVEDAGGQIENVAVIVQRQSDGQVWSNNFERAHQRFSPASTSKIPHTLIALEQGYAKPETNFFWDGVPRSVRAWNQDHSLATAFEESVVWVYQELARTAGRSAMAEALEDFRYGNSSVGSINQRTTYWLDNTLQISAAEQLEFLSRLAEEELELSGDTYKAIKGMMVSEARENWVLRSKTGWWHSKSAMDIGWFVGWLECSGETYVFALNMDMPDTRFLLMRKTIVYAILEHIDAFNCD